MSTSPLSSRVIRNSQKRLCPPSPHLLLLTVLTAILLGWLCPKGQVTRAQEAEENYLVKRELATVKQQSEDFAAQLEQANDAIRQLQQPQAVRRAAASPAGWVVQRPVPQVHLGRFGGGRGGSATVRSTNRVFDPSSDVPFCSSCGLYGRATRAQQGHCWAGGLLHQLWVNIS